MYQDFYRKVQDYRKTQRYGQAVMNAYRDMFGPWPDFLPDVWEKDYNDGDVAMWWYHVLMITEEK